MEGGRRGEAGSAHAPVNKTAQWAGLCIGCLLAYRQPHSVLRAAVLGSPRGAEKFGSLPQVTTISSKAGAQIQSAIPVLSPTGPTLESSTEAEACTGRS